MSLFLLLIITTLAVLGVSPATEAGPNESPSVISFRDDYIELTCDVYTNTEKAFEACKEENRQSGVRVFQVSYAEHGLIYPESWKFCEENEPYEVFGEVMNPCQL